MIFSRDYRRPFWHGFFHALLVTVYSLFLALIVMQMNYLYQGDVGIVFRTAFNLLLIIVSVAICAALIFYQPIRNMMHHHFRAATVMLLSTLGWLFIFVIIFLIGLSVTLL